MLWTEGSSFHKETGSVVEAQRAYLRLMMDDQVQWQYLRKELLWRIDNRPQNYPEVVFLPLIPRNGGNTPLLLTKKHLSIYGKACPES